MIDQREADNLLYRIAYASLGWYPDKSDRELDYTIDEDVDWCLSALTHVPDQYLTSMRSRIAEVIMDPTPHRETIRRDVLNLVHR